MHSTWIVSGLLLFICLSSTHLYSTAQSVNDGSVEVVIYHTTVDKFDVTNFKKQVAIAVTQYCSYNSTLTEQCGLSGKVTFSENEVKINKEDVVKQSFNVQFIVAVTYPNNSVSLGGSILPSEALSGAIVTYRKTFNQEAGYQVIQVMDEVFHIDAAEVTLNAVVSVVFLIITFILLTVVLVLRKQHEAIYHGADVICQKPVVSSACSSSIELKSPEKVELEQQLRLSMTRQQAQQQLLQQQLDLFTTITPQPSVSNGSGQTQNIKKDHEALYTLPEPSKDSRLPPLDTSPSSSSPLNKSKKKKQRREVHNNNETESNGM